MLFFVPRLIMAFILALALTIMPMPEFFGGVRPLWIMLLVIYIQCYLPEYFNLPVILVIGVILDVLLATVIGEHMFAIALVTWIISFKARRFYFFSMEQQMALIGTLCFIYELILWVVDSFLGYSISLVAVIGSAMISLLLWPWIRMIADDALLSKSNQRRLQ